VAGRACALGAIIGPMELPVDLRSDTVTKPSPEMRRWMYEAEVGDDIYGEDPTVNLLQEEVAELLGTEAALFVPSGTMANQVALRVHTQPGDEVIAHRDSHCIHYETGALAALSGCQVAALEGEGGLFTPDDVRQAVRPSRPYLPRSTLVVMENTHNRGGGTIWPPEQFAAVAEVAHELGLMVHLDGARLMNAAVALGVPPTTWTRHTDSVAICFSKGLGAPIGSAVAGSRDFIEEALRVRKMFGGAMRQVGVIAAAARYALRHNVSRLAEDHRRARELARGLGEIDQELGGGLLSVPEPQTNIVMVDLSPQRLPGAEELAQRLRSEQVLVGAFGPHRIRMVVHLDLTDQSVAFALEVWHRVLGEVRKG